MTPAAMAMAAILAGLAAPLAAQDAARGETVFSKCKTCHMVGDGAQNRVGPVLTGVVGRPAGSYEGYRYGASMVEAGESGLMWNAETVFDYLADPRGFLRDYLNDPRAKAKMTFRLKDETDRRDVIAYLATFSAAEPSLTDEPDAVAAADSVETAPDMLCVRNRDAHEHFFAVEAPGGERRTGRLAPGGRLCTSGKPGATGMVSVFENADHFEGCSRLVPVGRTEDMLKYVDFDRCFWGSNT